MSDEQGGQHDVSRKGPVTRLRAVAHWSARAPRTVVVLGIVALVLLALVVLPGYYAIQPSFLARHADVGTQYASWSASTHRDVACQSCHVPPSLTAQAFYSASMLGEFYLSFISPGRTLSLFTPPPNDACRNCHPGLVTDSPKGDLIIPHQAHVEVLKMRCVQCHAYLVHEKSPEGRHTPPMAACLKCHDGKQAKSACVTCHTAKAAPDSHAAADWLVVHAERQQGADCASCHGWTKYWCADCHSRRPPSHTAEWRTTHPVAVRTRRTCEACHAADFCIRCHGEVPSLNFDPALKLVK